MNTRATSSPHRTARHTATVVTTLLVALLAGGCAVGPDYRRPDVPVPAVYQELPGWAPAQPDADGPKGDWWTAFGDPLLDELEPQVAVSNQTVREDYANYQQALAEVRVARSALFPTIGVIGASSRQRSAGGSLASSGGRSFTPAQTVTNTASLEGNVSWAPDLWGQVQRTIEQNTATAQASRATLANATLSAQIALATAVINLRVADANTGLLEDIVAADELNLRVVVDQDRAGTVPPSDLITARTLLESARASLIALGVARAQDAHAIAVLVGRNPEDLTIPRAADTLTLPQVPAGLPSTLLQRRPDIAIAEREMAAANAAVGIAVAAWYPTISLTAVSGFAQSPVAGLLHVANYVWSLGASASETIFDGGARSATITAARAGYDAAVARYRGTVLSAFSNVENDLAALRILALQAEALDAAEQDARLGTRIARDEYEAGTVDFTTVAAAQTTELDTRQSVLNVRQQRLLAATSLIGDLGGGWSAQSLTAHGRREDRPTE